jgi:hypothetical protein
VAAYRHHVPNLCQLLRRLHQPGGCPAEYDVAGIANPFLQVKILRLLRHLGGWWAGGRLLVLWWVGGLAGLGGGGRWQWSCFRWNGGGCLYLGCLYTLGVDTSVRCCTSDHQADRSVVVQASGCWVTHTLTCRQGQRGGQ